MKKRIIYLLFASLFIPFISSAQQGDSLASLEPFVFWTGSNPVMTFKELASYCAPIFWFSPDEPELKNKTGKKINIPTNFPFEKASDKPVVYYQFRNVLKLENASGDAIKKDKTDKNNSTIDLSKVAAIDIDYSHYYRNEAGLGGHMHDTEQSQFKIYVNKSRHADSLLYKLILIQVTAKAHALPWYDNIYDLDTNSTELKLPFHILVEEGKHASCTDINGDGVYTPGYDVNVRTNDAWGLRDIIRTGSLFTADFQSYMAKNRKPEHRVFPPLPGDSPLREKYKVNGVYASDNAIYELRTMPNAILALPDKKLEHDMSGYAADRWPLVSKNTDSKKFFSWIETDLLIRSFAVNARYDNNDWGVSFAFPLLIVKNVETPLIGGWMVNRVYLQGEKLRDIGYNILITPSASRFIDPYFSAGAESKYHIDESGNSHRETEFVLETGLKFRANVLFSPLKFLSFLTDFWGLRLGVKNTGFPLIKNLNYTVELGAGVW